MRRRRRLDNTSMVALLVVDNVGVGALDDEDEGTA